MGYFSVKTTRTKASKSSARGAEAASGSPVDGFEPGDIVALKSGGPNMTVKSIRAEGFMDGDYYCQWFAGANLKGGYFHFDSLKRVKSLVDSLDIEPR